MEVSSIFFYSERDSLLETATMEAGLKNLKENISSAAFWMEIYPCPALPTLCQIFTISGDLGNRHLFTLLALSWGNRPQDLKG